MAIVKIVYPHLGIVDEVDESESDTSQDDEKQEGKE